MVSAERTGIARDVRSLSRDLGVPAVPTVARSKLGMAELVATVARVIDGDIGTSPLRVKHPPAVRDAIARLVPLIDELVPGLPNARWIALRLLDGDHRVRQALRSGELDGLARRQRTAAPSRRGRVVALAGAQ